MQIVLATVFKQAQSYIDSNGLAGMKAKSSIQILFFEKQGKIQLLNSNIPRRARTARYGNKKKAQDPLNLALFVFCSFFVLQRYIRATKRRKNKARKTKRRFLI